MPADDPIRELERWIGEARERDLAHPAAVAFVLWTRKAQEIEANPQVALLFHWPELGRQVHVTGEAVFADRALAEQLFAERDPGHQLQTVVSRQGEPIDDLGPLRDRLDHLSRVQETAPACPEDWGALRVLPETIELWEEAPDRLHEPGCSGARGRGGR